MHSQMLLPLNPQKENLRKENPLRENLQLMLLLLQKTLL